MQVPCGLRVTLTLDSLSCHGRGTVPRCPPKHPVSPVVVCAGAGKKISGQETERKRIEFIRAGDAVRTASQLKGKPTPLENWSLIFIASRQGRVALGDWLECSRVGNGVGILPTVGPGNRMV